MTVGQRWFATGHDGADPSVPRLLFALLGAPVIWGLHLVACYLLVTVDCITGWEGGAWSVILVTVVSVAGSVAAGRMAWLGWRRSGDGASHPSEPDWRRFLFMAGVAASVLFTGIIVATGVMPLFVPVCA